VLQQLMKLFAGSPVAVRPDRKVPRNLSDIKKRERGWRGYSLGIAAEKSARGRLP